MMRPTLLTLAATSACLGVLMAQPPSGPNAGRPAPSSPWPELTALKATLGDLWRAAQNSGDISLARAKAADLVAAARRLDASQPPPACRTPELRRASGAVAARARQLDEQAAAKAGDVAIGTSLAALRKELEVLEKGCGRALRVAAGR